MILFWEKFFICILHACICVFLGPYVPCLKKLHLDSGAEARGGGWGDRAWPDGFEWIRGWESEVERGDLCLHCLSPWTVLNLFRRTQDCAIVLFSSGPLTLCLFGFLCLRAALLSLCFSFPCFPLGPGSKVTLGSQVILPLNSQRPRLTCTPMAQNPFLISVSLVVSDGSFLLKETKGRSHSIHNGRKCGCTFPDNFFTPVQLIVTPKVGHSQSPEDSQVQLWLNNHL